MQRDIRAYLWDVQAAGISVQEFIGTKTLAEYSGDEMLRAAVERKFEIMGEAISQMKHHFPDTFLQISFGAKIIGFRNHLVHRYSAISDPTVWSVIQQDLPVLLAEVQALLDAETPLPLTKPTE